MEVKTFLAFDIGASSGRAVLISFQGEKFEMKEIHRFTNRILEMHGRYYWDIFHIYAELKQALTICGKEKVDLTSIGIDTWGVDFGLIGADGTILGLPRAYRDPYTSGVPETFFKEQMTRGDVYHRTGIQIMDFNSLYQLYQQGKENFSSLKQADKALFIPDLLAYMLTGNRVCEYTDASTSQLVNPYTKEMDPDLLEAAGVPLTLFDKIVLPGTVVGTLTKSLAQETGVGPVKVVAVAGHDTASAVAGVPTVDTEFAYLSSGTWSLFGTKLSQPITTEQAFRANYTNEIGGDGKVRFLRNIMGMWVIQECRREWQENGLSLDYPEIVTQAREAENTGAIIDINDEIFFSPGNMASKVKEYVRKWQGIVLRTVGEVAACVYQSMAIAYRNAYEELCKITQRRYGTLQILGGGSNNAYLNEMIARELGVAVLSGPSEASALGNALGQLIGLHVLSLDEIKDILSCGQLD